MTEPGMPVSLEDFRRKMAQANVLNLLCNHLLYDRSQETDLRLDYIKLVTERHNEFHNPEFTYEECRNHVCVNAKLRIEAARAPEVLLNQFAIELAKTFSIKITPSGEQALHAKLVRKDSIEPEKPNEGSRLVIIP